MSTSLVFLTTALEIPTGEEWLGPAERATLLRLRVPKRRRDFRLGRFAAKRAMTLLGGEPAPALGRFEVRLAPGGAPLAFRDGAPLAISLSISHSDGWASAAVGGTGALGCDLEHVEPRSPAFLEDYLTQSERAFVVSGLEGERALRATLLWSAKEAVMKALGEGLRLAPASVEVAPALRPSSEAGWRSFSVLAPPSADGLHGFWRSFGEFVLTVAGGLGEPLLVGKYSGAFGASARREGEGTATCRTSTPSSIG